MRIPSTIVTAPRNHPGNSLLPLLHQGPVMLPPSPRSILRDRAQLPVPKAVNPLRRCLRCPSL